MRSIAHRDAALALLCAACLFSAGACGADRTVADDWITGDLRSAFRLTGWIDASQLSVTTHNGVVRLSGRAASGAERALAIELARNVRGVRGVDASGLQQ
ncbi:MAG TPA: BON domain-containing protein [Nevskia sp.]|nr:BON domain-containing protein [Nevskia sp.]